MSCGITVHYGDEPVTVASSDSWAPLIDAEQYDVGEGPCLEALRTGQLVDVADQGTDERWPAYAERARELEVPLASRPLIAQAIGVIMAQQHCNAHVAFTCSAGSRRRTNASCARSPAT